MKVKNVSDELERHKIFLLWLTCLIGGIAPVHSQVIFQTDFESSEGYTVEALDSQLDWSASDFVSVDTIDPHSGTQLIWLPANDSGVGHQMSFLFNSVSADSVVYVDFYFSPNAVSSFAELPDIVDYPVAELTGLVNTGNGLGEWVVAYGDGSGGGVWQPTGSYVELEDNAVSEYLWYVYKLDYHAKVYDFFLNGTPIAKNVPFIDSSLTQLTQFKLNVDGKQDAYFDKFTVSYDMPSGLYDGREQTSTVIMDSNSNEIFELDEANVAGAHAGHMDDTQRSAQAFLSNVADSDIALYVDCTLGDDSYDGLSAVPGSPTAASGPKASINAALSAANDADIIRLQPCTYEESILNLNGKNLTLHLNGPVTVN